MIIPLFTQTVPRHGSLLGMTLAYTLNKAFHKKLMYISLESFNYLDKLMSEKISLSSYIVRNSCIDEKLFGDIVGESINSKDMVGSWSKGVDYIYNTNFTQCFLVEKYYDVIKLIEDFHDENLYDVILINLGSSYSPFIPYFFKYYVTMMISDEADDSRKHIIEAAKYHRETIYTDVVNTSKLKDTYKADFDMVYATLVRAFSQDSNGEIEIGGMDNFAQATNTSISFDELGEKLEQSLELYNDLKYLTSCYLNKISR